MLDRHGPEPHGERSEGDRHRRYSRAHQGSEARHGRYEAAVRVRSDGGGGRGSRDPQGSACTGRGQERRSERFPAGQQIGTVRATLAVTRIQP